MAKILLIDDDESIRKLLRTVLRSMGHAVIEASNGRDGLKLCSEVDLVILDIFMRKMNGIEVLLDLRRRHSLVKVIVISGAGGPGAGGDLNTAALLGAVKTLQKPFILQELMAAVNEVLPVDDERLPAATPGVN